LAGTVSGACFQASDDQAIHEGGRRGASSRGFLQHGVGRSDRERDGDLDRRYALGGHADRHQDDRGGDRDGPDALLDGDIAEPGTRERLFQPAPDFVDGGLEQFVQQLVGQLQLQLVLFAVVLVLVVCFESVEFQLQFVFEPVEQLVQQLQLQLVEFVLQPVVEFVVQPVEPEFQQRVEPVDQLQFAVESIGVEPVELVQRQLQLVVQPVAQLVQQLVEQRVEPVDQLQLGQQLVQQLVVLVQPERGMNRLVDRWNRHVRRPKRDGPDSVVIDGEKLTLRWEKKDGQRPEAAIVSEGDEGREQARSR